MQDLRRSTLCTKVRSVFADKKLGLTRVCVWRAGHAGHAGGGHPRRRSRSDGPAPEVSGPRGLAPDLEQAVGEAWQRAQRAAHAHVVFGPPILFFFPDECLRRISHISK